MFDSKRKQRERLKAARLKLSDTESQEKSLKVSEKALETISELKARSVHVYLPIESNKEVDTWFLVKELLKQDVSVHTSVFGESRSLKHVRLQEDTVYDVDNLGIPIPTSNFEQSEEEYDVIIVPLLGFDKKLWRIGYGRGVYDTFLSEQPKAVKIGLGYEIQRIKCVKTENHDEKLDKVITEVQLYN